MANDLLRMSGAHRWVLILNETAMAFLELCDGQRSTADIIKEMSQQYEVGHDELKEDLKEFIRELTQAGIIHAVPEGQ